MQIDSFMVLYDQYLSDLEQLILKKNEYASKLELSKQYWYKKELETLYGVFKMMDKLKVMYSQDMSNLLRSYNNMEKNFKSIYEAYQVASTGEAQQLQLSMRLLKAKETDSLTFKTVAA